MGGHHLRDDPVESLLPHDRDPLIRVGEQEQGVTGSDVEQLPRTLGDDDLTLGATLTVAANLTGGGVRSMSMSTSSSVPQV